MSLQVSFYNIGWTDSQLSGQNHEMHRKQLGRDCAGAFEFNDLGMRCLCEVGTNQLDENLHAHLGNSAGFQDKYGEQNVNTWLEQVIHECCKISEPWIPSSPSSSTSLSPPKCYTWPPRVTCDTPG